jgi:hypothetical protein
MPEAAGRRNAYGCQGCGGVIVTINRDEGVTPMFLRCRMPDSCGEMMASTWYQLPPDAPEPSWEWYRPSASALRRLKRRDPATADYVERGGLLLRRLGVAGEREAVG